LQGSAQDDGDDVVQNIRRLVLLLRGQSLSEEYIGCLTLRRPEALVILSHYAAHLHYYRDLWDIRGWGEFLIENITEHLGSDWESWLAWRNEVLKQDERFNQAT
jgi:hypothetical protein